MLVSGQNALRCFRKSWPIVPGLQDPVRPLRQVPALPHFEKDLALYLDAHPGYLDCGTDPLPDGNMEAAGTGAYVPTTVVLSKSLINPHGGLQSLQLDFNGASALGQASCAGFTIGQTYRAILWYYSDGTSQFHLTDGGAVVGMYPAVLGWNRVIYQGVWSGTVLGLRCPNLAAGVFLRIDDITVTPLNVTTWADRTRRGGRNPTQVVAARRPVRTDNDQPSGRTSTVFDGVDDHLATPLFTLNQPYVLNIVHASTDTGAVQTYLTDGSVFNTANVYYPVVANQRRMYAGVAGPTMTIVSGAWGSIQATFDGAASIGKWLNGTESVANVGGSNAGQLWISSGNGGGGSVIPSRWGSAQAYSRALSPNERINITVASMRRACI